MKNKLTKEEKNISKDILDGKYRSVPKSKISKYRKMAKADIKRRKQVRKEERINVRLTAETLTTLKGRAEKEGIPYQTLVTSVLHKYLNGRLVDIQNVSAIKRALK